ncbi:MAG: cbb3-type cytochrome c oxidase subunit I [Gracilimonas sp.]|uniref:cbb3-type cytochrome c oxidase subunit I n=1 Tax=Gracilimonas TaxID=649462 RepID=UPI001B19E0F5|nr:cbb3-type cytochrome c oxidase subunit I [Gracilimonas sp.]MBO6586058.1 cbb3-type cytochrome c oxidase subunit I [Gracilimonas sp.]MBO6614715.1 cbb3-type cytochrome c oxidase subunit I [Gracilimonas sp.]
MTLPSRLLIKSSLICLLVGVLLGALILINKALNIDPEIWGLLPVHIELMIFGWIIQFTLGVAYWILPRYLKGEARGNRLPAYLMVLLFNLGIWLMVFAELTEAGDYIHLVARGLEFSAVVLFISLHWKRIVSFNKNRH